MCWSDVDALLTGVSEQHRIPDLVVSIESAERPRFLRSWSSTGEDEQPSNATTDQLFMLGSISKMLVAAAVMRLCSTGVLSLDTPVGEYCEFLPIGPAGAGTATIRSMLSHTAGFAKTRLEWQRNSLEYESLEAYVRERPLAHARIPQNTDFTYSSLAYDVLGYVIERTTSIPFEEYIRRELLDPLGMADTTYKPEGALAERVAEPHAGTGDYRMAGEPPPYCPAHAPSAGLYSTATDLATWARFQLARGSIGGKQLIPKDCFDAMWMRHVETGQPDNPYAGLGCFVGGTDAADVIGHGGREAGFNNLLLFVPARGLSVVLLSNWHDAPIMETGQHVLGLALAAGQPQAARA